MPDDVRYLHVGTLGLTLEPVATATEAVVERLSGRALIALDPNIRPWVIADPEAYRARLGRVLARSHVLKVSEEDLDWLYPDLPAVEAIREMLELGPTVGLLTRGPNGALVVTRTAEVAVPAAAGEGRRHDRGRRRVRRRLPRLVERARPDARGPRDDRPSCGSNRVRVSGRRTHLLAPRRRSTAPIRTAVLSGGRNRSSRHG